MEQEGEEEQYHRGQEKGAGKNGLEDFTRRRRHEPSLEVQVERAPKACLGVILPPPRQVTGLSDFVLPLNDFNTIAGGGKGRTC